jgi:hypothetical protein
MPLGTPTQLNTGISATATTTCAFLSTPALNTLLVLIVGADDYRLTTGSGRPESTGWTLVSPGGSQQTNLGFYMWWKLADGVENSVQYTIGSASPSTWAIGACTGVDTTSPLDIANGQFTLGPGTFDYSTPSVVPTTGNRVAFAALGAAHNPTAITGVSGWTNSYTEISDNRTSPAGTQDAIGLAWLTLTGNGSTATSTTGTWAGANPDAATSIIAVFKEATAANPGDVADNVGITDSVTPVLDSPYVPIPVAFDSASAWVASTPTTSPTAVAPSYPSGVSGAGGEGKLVRATIVLKLGTGSVATPANWTLVGSDVVGSGTLGAGTGTVRVYRFQRTVPSGGLTGTQSFTLTGTDTALATMHAYSYNATGFNLPEWVYGNPNTSHTHASSTTVGGTGAAGIDLAVGDVVNYVNVVPDDTVITITALAASGATLSSFAVQPATAGTSANGNDIGASAAIALVTAGSSNVAPTATATAAAAETGGGVWIRIRAIGVPAPSAANPADNVGITDAAVRVADALRSQDDPVGITDSVTALVTVDRSQSDPVGITDSLAVVIGAASTTNDPVGITDAVTVVSARNIAPADPVGITDSLVLARAATQADPVGITDAVVAGMTKVINISDNVGILDTDTAQTIIEDQTIDDPVGITDAAARTAIAVRPLADPVGVTDAALTTAAAVRAQSDPVGLTDAVSAGFLATRTPADPVGITDAVSADLTTAGAANLNDAVNITDVAAAAAAAVRSAADPVGITDTVTTDLGKTPADTVGITDALALLASALRAPADPVGISDEVTVSMTGAASVNPSDPVGISDTVTTLSVSFRTPTDTVGLTDTVTAVLSATITKADNVGITDVIDLTRSTGHNPTENVAITDQVTVEFAGLSNKLVTEVVGIDDVTTITISASRLSSDPVGITDVIVTSVGRTITRTDAVGISDSISIEFIAVSTRTVDDIVNMGDRVYVDFDPILPPPWIPARLWLHAIYTPNTLRVINAPTQSEGP